jgi:hypothetical protein
MSLIFGSSGVFPNQHFLLVYFNYESKFLFIFLNDSISKITNASIEYIRQKKREIERFIA